MGTLRAWILTDGKAGDENQCLAVAEALGLAFELRRVAPRAPWSLAMPRGPVDPREAPDRPGSPIAPPFPDIAIASGRRAVAYLRRVKRESGGRTFTVFLKDPRTGSGAADLVWVPEHDRLRGDNVIVTPAGPHRHSAAKLAEARKDPWPEIAALAHPRVAVLAGGDSRSHRYAEDDIARFAEGLRAFAAQRARLMITTSRRTPAGLAQALRSIAAEGGHLLWEGEGANPAAAISRQRGRGGGDRRQRQHGRRGAGHGPRGPCFPPERRTPQIRCVSGGTFGNERRAPLPRTA